MSNFTGAMTALITPFHAGKIDETAFRNLISWQIEQDIDGIVPSGTTGEAATLRLEEHFQLISIAVAEADGRFPVIAGTGSNNTEHAIHLGLQAKKAGADAHLSVTPYYNKPTQEGLYQHYKAIAEAVDLPLILYNVPGRTAVNMLPETVARLSKISNIVGLKEACGHMQQVRDVVAAVPSPFIILSGEDAQNADIYAAGGKGCISVTSNVAPKLVSEVWDLWTADKKDEAFTAQEKLQSLNQAMFFETNPLPAKTSLALMGRCREEFRLPLTAMGKENRVKLYNVLQEYQFLS
ncbi:MAG: 4-hydroxy-tetrahydrodipicolinate synthase [Deltaproteobacteria bacterium]|nr:4-hydroxy-tetrahydrodipicolinate synthase [Deltaproteobacteria bacterium]